jgi:hypothetical protein
MKSAEQQFVDEQHKRELLELKIRYRVALLELDAAKLWCDLVRRADDSPVGWLERAARE